MRKELVDTTVQHRTATPLKQVSERSKESPPASDENEHHKRRKAGKRSDPAFRPTTVFVKKETQRKATRLLEDQDAGKDFSDLVEELVANWIIDHSRV